MDRDDAMKPTIPYDEILNLYRQGYVQKQFTKSVMMLALIRRAFKLGLKHHNDFELHRLNQFGIY